MLESAIKAPQLLWHYTTGEKFVLIVEDGEIRLATAGVPKGERPAVWFSANPRYEQTAVKAMIMGGRLQRLTMDETAAHARGLVRIGVTPEVAPVSWAVYQKTSGISRAHARHLVRWGKAQGANPRDWYASFDPVPRALWSTIDVWHNGSWVPVPFDR